MKIQYYDPKPYDGKRHLVSLPHLCRRSLDTALHALMIVDSLFGPGNALEATNSGSHCPSFVSMREWKRERENIRQGEVIHGRIGG